MSKQYPLRVFLESPKVGWRDGGVHDPGSGHPRIQADLVVFARVISIVVTIVIMNTLIISLLRSISSMVSSIMSMTVAVSASIIISLLSFTVLVC